MKKLIFLLLVAAVVAGKTPTLDAKHLQQAKDIAQQVLPKPKVEVAHPKTLPAPPIPLATTTDVERITQFSNDGRLEFHWRPADDGDFYRLNPR